MFFELFSFGCSLNSSDGPLHQMTLYPSELTSVPADELASGVIGELLTFCRAFSRRSGCAKTSPRKSDSFSIQLFFVPLLFTCFAYLLIVIVIRVSQATEVEESTIPQQVFCFGSLLKPFVEVLPQPRLLVASGRVPSLWHSLWQETVKEEAELPEPAPAGHGRYWAPEPDVEYFDPVLVNAGDITWKPMKSLFSYDNWY